MFHPAIVEYSVFRCGEVDPIVMEKAVTCLKKSLEEGQNALIACVNWDAMSKAAGLSALKFLDVYHEGWTDPKFKATIQAIAYCSDLADKELEDFL